MTQKFRIHGINRRFFDSREGRGKGWEMEDGKREKERRRKREEG